MNRKLKWIASILLACGLFACKHGKDSGQNRNRQSLKLRLVYRLEAIKFPKPLYKAAFLTQSAMCYKQLVKN